MQRRPCDRRGRRGLRAPVRLTAATTATGSEPPAGAVRRLARRRFSRRIVFSLSCRSHSSVSVAPSTCSSAICFWRFLPSNSPDCSVSTGVEPRRGHVEISPCCESEHANQQAWQADETRRCEVRRGEARKASRKPQPTKRDRQLRQHSAALPYIPSRPVKTR